MKYIMGNNMEKTVIIKLDVIDVDFKEKSVFSFTLGYYSSYDKVDEILSNIHMKFDVQEETIFIAEEIYLDTVMSFEDVAVSNYRQYRWVQGKIQMTHETLNDFHGYMNDNDYQYKVGDIINYFINDKMYTGIVGDVPPKYKQGKEKYYEYYDDSYLGYHLGNGDTHNHALTVNIIGLARVEPDTYKAYKDKLKERMKLW